MNILSEEESLLAFARNIAEAVRHPLLVLDAHLSVVAVNVAYYRALDTTPGDTLGQSFFLLVGGVWNVPELREQLREIVLNGGAFDGFEVEIEIPKAAPPRIFAVNARRITRDTDGEPMVLVAIEDETIHRHDRIALERANLGLEDLVALRTTDLEAANRDLRHTVKELATVNHELEAFCYSVSHDLRTPLRAIDGFSQELVQSHAAQLDPQAQHYLRRIRSGTQRMGQLIDDLLALSRVTRVELNRVSVDLSALAETVAAELRQLEPRRQVDFVSQPGLSGNCDPRLTRILLENLLGNAWKFTAKKSAASVEFGATNVGGELVFVVRDDGAGFDPAFKGKLFGAFQRLHLDRDFPGTGIGLATVQRIVRRHGGEIWAEAKVDQGAAFYFTLPDREHKA